MGKRMRLVASMMAMVMTTGVMFGCSSKDETKTTTAPENSAAATTAPKEDKKDAKGSSLTVWSHLTDPEVEEVDKIAQEWAKENGVEVTVVSDKSEMQAFLQAANSGAGPDIMYGLAHDNLGTFEAAGILAEVPQGFINPSDYTSKAVIDAVTIGGRQWAVPIAQESIGLFYNKDLVANAPSTMDELVKVGVEKGFKFDINNFYVAYGFIAGHGGYVFKDNNGTLDPMDIGLGTSGSVEAYQFLQDLVQKHKLMPADITGDIGKGDFISGKTGLYISGPWDVGAAKEAGLNFGVAPLPTTNGKATPCFLGVQTAFVSATSDNQELAWGLMKYLNEKSGEMLYTVGNRLPVLNTMVSNEKFQADEYAKGFLAQANNAMPMPNIPEVAAMWTPAADNLKLLTSGQIDAATCAKTIVEQIKVGVEQQK